MASRHPNTSLEEFREHLVCSNCGNLCQDPCLDSVCKGCLEAHPVEAKQEVEEPPSSYKCNLHHQ